MRRALTVFPTKQLGTLPAKGRHDVGRSPWQTPAAGWADRTFHAGKIAASSLQADPPKGVFAT